MKKEITPAVGVVVFFAVLLASLAITGLAGCPTGPSSPGETARITITGMPSGAGTGINYLILNAEKTSGAAVLDGNLNPNPSGTAVPWPAIQGDRAVIDLYDGGGFTNYLSSLRYNYSLPPLPDRKTAAGSGTVTVVYSTGNSKNPDKQRIWGGQTPLKFQGDLVLRWADGVE
jgi:hypothetical protein